MSTEALKEQARTHEKKEEWDKAIDLYNKAIAKLEADEQPDISLYNRVADIQVRRGSLEDAVKNYERAIDLYLDAQLPNNAIAVCKKIVRNMPMRHSVYLKMGQIRGMQGFLTEARLNFLTYAERMQDQGDIDEALRSLTELADLAPEDVEVRLGIAGQMKSHGREDDAITQLQIGHRIASQRGLPTEPFEAMLEELGSEPGDVPLASAGDEPEEAASVFGEILLSDGEVEEAQPEPASVDTGDEIGEFGEIVIGGDEAAPADEVQEAQEEVEEEAEEDATPLPTFDFSSDEESDEAVALPMLGDDEDEEEAEPLPLLGDGFAATAGDPSEGEAEETELDSSAFGVREEREASEYVTEGEELPELEPGVLGLDDEVDDSAPAREAAMEESHAEARHEDLASPPPVSARRGGSENLAPRPQRAAPEKDPMGHEALAERGDVKGAMGALQKLLKDNPNDLTLRHRMVEYASQIGDDGAMVTPWLDLADAFQRLHQPEKAKPLYEQVLAADPQNAQALVGLGQAPETATGGDFVDLGSMILDDDEGQKSTRFVVAYEEPSGDEQADFAKMLSQFKAKVAQNLSSDDVKAHQDLGTAYKEMGLIDEAISEFQQALRASSDHLPSYELLGQCFLEKGEPEATVRTLKRALDVPREVEDELLGIYYWLGRAHQQLGNADEAVEFYDRVFSLDINFADVTERLRALR